MGEHFQKLAAFRVLDFRDLEVDTIFFHNENFVIS